MASGTPVRCYKCKTAGRYIDGTIWRCERCGGMYFSWDIPVHRKTWWEQFNDILLTDHTLQRLADNPIARKALKIRWR